MTNRSTFSLGQHFSSWRDLHQRCRDVASPFPLTPCQITKVAMCVIPFLSSLCNLHSVICLILNLASLDFLPAPLKLFACLECFFLPASWSCEPLRPYFLWINHWIDPASVLLPVFGFYDWPDSSQVDNSKYIGSHLALGCTSSCVSSDRLWSELIPKKTIITTFSRVSMFVVVRNFRLFIIFFFGVILILSCAL